MTLDPMKLCQNDYDHETILEIDWNLDMYMLSDPLLLFV